jgi:hypothetical protein
MQKKLIVLFIMALAVFGVQEAAHAGGQGSVQFIYPDANATGTDVHATVTLFFTQGIDPFTGNSLTIPPNCNPSTNPNCKPNPLTIWFMLVKTPDKLVDAGMPALLSYDGMMQASLEANPACSCDTAGCCPNGIDPTSVQAQLINSIENTTFFSDLNITCKNPNKSPTIVLKSYSDFIQSSDSAWVNVDAVFTAECVKDTGD